MSSLFFTAYPSELKRFERDFHPPCALHWAILEILDDSTLENFGEREQSLNGWEVDTGTQRKPLKAFALRLAKFPDCGLLSVEIREERGKVFLKFVSRHLQRAKANADRRKEQRSRKKAFRSKPGAKPQRNEDSAMELDFLPDEAGNDNGAFDDSTPIFPENRKES